MLSHDRATELLLRLLQCEKEQVFIANGIKRASKRADKEYVKALRETFQALTGEQPTTEELESLSH